MSLPYPLTVIGNNQQTLSSKSVQISANASPDSPVTFAKIRTDTSKIIKALFKNSNSANANANANATYFSITPPHNTWANNSTYGQVSASSKELSITWSNEPSMQPLSYSSAFPDKETDDSKKEFAPAIAKMYIQYVVTYVCDALSKLVVDKKSLPEVQNQLDARFTYSMKAMLTELSR